MLKSSRPDLVLISRLQRPSVEVMERQKGRWMLLYQDAWPSFGAAPRAYDDRREQLLPDRATSREIGDVAAEGPCSLAWPAYQPTVSTDASGRHDGTARRRHAKIGNSDLEADVEEPAMLIDTCHAQRNTDDDYD